MTVKAKTEMSKTIGPKKLLTLQECEEEAIENTELEDRDELQKIIVEYRNVFKDKLPKVYPLWKEVTHSIEVLPGIEPTYWMPYQLRPTEQDELEEQVRNTLDQGFIRSKQIPYDVQSFFS